MAAKALPDADVLRQLIEYHPETGRFFWKKRPVSMFVDGGHTAEHNMKRWNSRHAGTEAICKVLHKGYLGGRLCDRQVFAHRVAWKIATNQDPDQIDHINGDKADNRLINLRPVNNVDNSRNRKVRFDSPTGVTGVTPAYYNGSIVRWRVKLCDEYLGLFKCLGQAIEARREAERQHGFHPNHGRR